MSTDQRNVIPQLLTGHELFLVVNLPAHPLLEKTNPPGNYFATMLLARLLDAKLEMGGQLRNAAICSGPLNQSLCIFFVREVHEAARIMAEALAQNGMAYFAQIYRADQSELIYRNLSAPGKDMGMQDLHRIAALSDDLVAELKKQCADLRKKLPPNGDSSANPPTDPPK